MPITIAVVKKTAEPQQSPFALVDSELVEYLRKLEVLPAMQRLSELDPYADTLLTASEREELLREVSQVEAMIQGSRLPVPPDYVGLEGCDDPGWGEEFGWGGLSRFAKQLKSVLELAARKGADVVAIGD